ncbi:MAG: site-2 protease family protein [Deltaproteobacteria bacterium]|jgi:Zn-dependent protease|nr:MAG: site-2 protease family protein [Deltaproteobacteria bacterium]
MTTLIDVLFQVLILFFSVIIHEVAHGYAALTLGDPTARQAGRLTLNPIKHMDPWGTVVLPLFLILVRSPFLVGWARPVPVNPLRMRDPKKGMMLVGAAGPLANIALILLSALALRSMPFSAPPILFDLFKYCCAINIILALFNLVPVPPLDGSKVVAGILPPKMRAAYVGLERYGIFIIIGLLYLGLLDQVIIPLYRTIFYLLVQT